MENNNAQMNPPQMASEAPILKKVFLVVPIILIVLAAGIWFYRMSNKAEVPAATTTSNVGYDGSGEGYAGVSGGGFDIAEERTERARDVLQRIKDDIGLTGEIIGGVESFGSVGYQINYNGEDKDINSRLYPYLKARLPLSGGAKYVTELSESYESGSVLCMRGDPRRYEPTIVSDKLSFIWCTDRRLGGDWEIPLEYKNITHTDLINKIITATIWGEAVKVKVVGIAETSGYADGSLEDFINFTRQYPNASATIKGTWNGDVLETRSIDWVNG